MSEFDKEFKKSIGFTPEMLRYKVEDMLERLSSIEGKMSEYAPVIGASMLKMEAILSLLDEKGAINQVELTNEMDRIANLINIDGFLENKS